MEAPPFQPPAAAAAKAAAAAADAAAAEAAVREFQAAYDRVKDRPCRVGSVHIEGLQRTAPALVHRELERARAAATLDEVKEALLAAYEALQDLDIFEAVDLKVDASPDAPDRCAVVARFAEKNLLKVHMGTYVQGTEGSVESSATLRNALGRAEQLTASAERGSRATSIYSLGAALPRVGGRAASASVTLSQDFHSSERWASFTALQRGGALALASDDGRHRASYELAWRRLADPSRRASRAVVAQLGDQLKSAARYTFRHDAFDDARFPSRGWGVRAAAELCGIGPDPKLLRYAKHEVAAGLALPLWRGAAATLTGESGLVAPWGRGRVGPGAADRFQLGGLGGRALRGFGSCGVGPTDERRPEREDGATPRSGRGAAGRDYLGGDAYFSLLARVNVLLPGAAMRDAGIYASAFVNGGSLVPLGGGGVRDRARELAATTRWTVGVGLVWPTSVGQLELNLCRVLASQPHDRVKAGLQFGFSSRAL